MEMALESHTCMHHIEVMIERSAHGFAQCGSNDVKTIKVASATCLVLVLLHAACLPSQLPISVYSTWLESGPSLSGCPCPCISSHALRFYEIGLDQRLCGCRTSELAPALTHTSSMFHTPPFSIVALHCSSFFLTVFYDCLFFPAGADSCMLLVTTLPQ